MNTTVSKILAIVFAAIAAIALFMPVLSESGSSASQRAYINSDNNVFKTSFLDEDARQSVDTIDAALKTGFLKSKMETYAKQVKQMIIASTIAIFGVIAAAVCVLIGKITKNKKLAMIMSFIGVCSAGFLLITIFMLCGTAKDIAGEDVLAAGAGPILMTIGMAGALVFSAASNE